MKEFDIKIFGIVQGVGFRPFIKNLADKFKISGNVANKGSYVEIFAAGESKILKNFVDAIPKKAPARSAILKIDVTEIEFEKKFSGFEIVESKHETGDIFVSPDIAICEKCREELFNPNDRRYLHPFINCTACGPRLTILKNMPYDRERTSMGDFPMCEKCSEEYHNPISRRYDAQPVCCNDCGPEVYIFGKNIRGAAAIKFARKILAGGGIVAVKGIGGFHLACDAKNFSAVERLRKNKIRPTKPFAVMFRNIDALKNECDFSPEVYKILESPQKPIVLLPKKSGGKIAGNVAPEINKLGTFLPYTPLHLLLFDYPDEIENFPDALVMTSGNPSGVPISIEDEDAQKNFGDFCDAIISHNRKILLRADDSVTDFFAGELSMIRRSRGYAPLPIFVNAKSGKNILAVGGELKNTFCLAKNNLLYASPYIGDMTDLRTVEVLKNSINRMKDLLEIEPEVVACDFHPRYHTTEFAESLNLPVVKIQHHYAHILTVLAENNFFGEVVGISFDGTGYGDDGTIWGGEIFVCDSKNYRRVGHISKFSQAGGDKSSREGWRIALSLMKNFPDIRSISEKLNLATPAEISGQLFLLKKNLNCIDSTSCGRIFDAVSAILGICKNSTYEGEAAMKLQTVAENFAGNLAGNFDFEIGEDLILPTDKLFEKILIDRLNGENIYKLARFFHAGLAGMIANACEKISRIENIKTVALGGGVFQNSLLAGLTIENLQKRGLKVLRNKTIPPNDGGICIGQAFRLFD